MSKFELKKIENGRMDFIGSTIFHDPDFLSYHGAKFEEYHLGEELFGILPLAIAERENGASYGGFVFKAILIQKKFIEYELNNSIMSPIVILLFEQGFNAVNSDITSILTVVILRILYLLQEQEIWQEKQMSNLKQTVILMIFDGKNFSKTKEELAFLQNIFPNDNTPVAGMGVFNINQLCSMIVNFKILKH